MSLHIVAADGLEKPRLFAGLDSFCEYTQAQALGHDGDRGGDRGITAITDHVANERAVDLEKGLISIDSPLARALLKKTVDDEVTLSLPQGKTVYTVLEIRYSPFDGAG